MGKRRPALAPVFEGSFEEYVVRFMEEHGYVGPCDIPADECDRLIAEAVRSTPAQFYPTQAEIEAFMEREFDRMFVDAFLGSGMLSAEQELDLRQWAGARGVWE